MADANNLTLKDKIASVTIVVSIVALPISIFRVKSLPNTSFAHPSSGLIRLSISF
jgi:hypothetical protein